MTLCGWYARQTISLSVLERNPNKGLEVEISDGTKSGGGKESPREDRSQLKRDPVKAVENGQQKRPGGVIEGPGEGRLAEGGSEGRRSNMS